MSLAHNKNGGVPGDRGVHHFVAQSSDTSWLWGRVIPSAGIGALGLALAACGAPESRPAEGPVAEEVRTALASGTDPFEHAVWDSLLAEGTRDGLVDYAYFESRMSTLDRYLADIGSARLARLASPHLMALLINAYNAYTIQSILDNPGISSIRDIPGVWTDRTHLVGGYELTLDQIEHNLLRPFFRDPRIHFAVNCASMSCAPLPGWAFDGDRLEDQLEERTAAFLSADSNVRMAAGVLELSKYFDWYGEDFVADGWEPRAASIPEFIAPYASTPVRQAISRSAEPPPLSFLDYDWSLNAVPRP